jgi:hypothetical protein
MRFALALDCRSAAGGRPRRDDRHYGDCGQYGVSDIYERRNGSRFLPVIGVPLPLMSAGCRRFYQHLLLSDLLSVLNCAGLLINFQVSVVKLKNK